MTITDQEKKGTGGTFAPNHIVVDRIHSNTSTEVIFITEDKLRLKLKDYTHSIERSKDWHVPLAFSLTLSGTLLTSNFKNFLSIEAQLWQFGFSIALAASLVWLLVSVIGAYRAEKMEDVISSIKGQ